MVQMTELGCRVDTFSISHMGFPLGGQITDCNSWEPMVEMFRSKLAQRKTRHLLMGKRITLIKAVLCFLPIYSLLIRILPMSLQNTLHSLMDRFLRGEIDERMKIHLIDWLNVTYPCDRGDLGFQTYRT